MHAIHTPSSATPLVHRLQSSLARKPWRWAALAAVPLVAAVSFFAVGQVSPPVIPLVTLATEPLYAATATDKPTLALALSVEFPTVGAQYRGTTDYSNTIEFLGYYDAESCYTYNSAPSEVAKSATNFSDYKRFDRSGPATNRTCADAYSGNFLNWASSSAIDMLRLALSGGDRYIDTASLTVLQRAVLPNGDPSCFWNNGSYFPAKTLQKDGSGTGKYWGAIPLALRTAAGTNNITISNVLNRIYFKAGTAAGDCNSTHSEYDLFGTPSTLGNASPFQTTVNGSLPSDAALCATTNGTCTINNIVEVWYGRNSNWVVTPASTSYTCNTTNFGSPSGSGTKSCYIRPYTGPWVPTDGFLYARASVCEKDSSTGVLLDMRDYTFCSIYPNGNYKPTGVIQKYSEQMRLAAFGYLMDQTASYNSGGRYGGVLRAPMKYVGAKTFDITGTDSGTSNPKREWNLSNGVFEINPEADSEFGISGVINYLNKFGRTGSVQGKYKQYDPVGELYYETLRYLQGLPPSAAAISNVTTTLKDGFPVYTDWSDATGVGDPYGGGRSAASNYSCQKNNIVVIGDVNTHEGGISKFPSTNVASNYPDLAFWRSIVSAFELGNTLTYTDGQGTSRTTSNPNTANPNPRGGSFDLNTGDRRLFTGYAYWAHTQDIRGTAWTTQPTKQRPGLRVKSFFFDVNENSTESTNNNRRYGNQFFTSAKYGGFESDPNNLGGDPYNTFGNPFRQQDGTANNNVWQKINAPDEASTYYLQSDARGVLSAFDEIFSRATTSARSIAGSAVQSKNLREQTANAIYQGTFDTSDWSGDLYSIPVTTNTANVVTISASNNWTAASKLNQLATPVTTRNIVVGSAGATSNPTARNFLWGSIDSTLETHLNKVSPSATPDGLAQARLEYLRGKRTLEGTTFRRRNSLLGDIVNSAVVYSGKPATNINSASYATFVATVNALNNGTGRKPAVFVGANDGMLHAFEATAGVSTSGQELFAYIPSWMGPKLSALTQSSYVNNHQAYVDGPPVVTEALVSQNPDVWKTVLVSGTGAGGRGVFALDVTNPSTFGPSNVMWEFTQLDDREMGYVIGRPQIVKLRTNSSSGAAQYRWFAAVASGVNNYQDDGLGNFSSSGAPVLFLLALDKAVGDTWTNLGSTPNYYKITLPLTTTATASGLANFSVTLGTAGEAKQMYMGDLHGNLWKLDFDLASNGTADWTAVKLSPFIKTVNGTPTAYPLYIAKDGTVNTNRQPITMAPSLIRGESASSTYVAFGTGKYLEVADKSSTAQQSVYAVFDNESTTSDDASNTLRGSVIRGRDRLQAGTATTSTGVVAVAPFTWGRPAVGVNLATTSERAGWFFDLPYTGERQVSNAKSVGDYLIFSSLIPGASGTAGTCTAAGGGGAEYTINIDTGDGTFRTSTVGILGEPLVMEIASATTYTQPDNTGRRKKRVVNQTIQQGSSGLAATSSFVTEFVAGRLSWRQINNYQDLKN